MFEIDKYWADSSYNNKDEAYIWQLSAYNFLYMTILGNPRVTVAHLAIRKMWV